MAGVLLLAVTAVQAATAEQSCKSGKNKTAGKYAACRENAEAKLAKGGDPSKYTDALDKCESKFSDAWDKLEAKALAASASCPAEDTRSSILPARFSSKSARVRVWPPFFV